MHEVDTEFDDIQALMKETMDQRGGHLTSEKDPISWESPFVTFLKALVALGFFLAVCSGAICAYLCNKRFYRPKSKDGIRPEAATIDMQFASAGAADPSPSSGRHASTPSQMVNKLEPG